MPPLHIKHRLVKQFAKALNFEGSPLKKITKKSLHFLDDKLRGGVPLFTGSEITRMLKAEDLEKAMSAKEKHAWRAIRDVTVKCLGN